MGRLSPAGEGPSVRFPPEEPVPWARRTDGGWTLAVRVQPGARRSEIVGELGDELKVRLAAPPVDGRANAELVRFVAELAGVPRRNVRLTLGHSSRSKVVEVRTG